jgi:hypothetical protein
MTSPDIPVAPPEGSVRRVWQAGAPLRWAVAIGGVSGAISAGLGARVVMRIIALANPGRDGVNTDAEATVGQITFGGTVNLLILGTIAGIMGGLLYLGLRRWLPVPASWKGLVYGVVTLATVGNPLFDTNNADFQIFEPVLMVIALFSVLFFVNGVVVAYLLNRFHPEPTYATSPRSSRVATALIAVVCVIGTVGMVFGAGDMLNDEGTCFSAAGGGKGCAVLTEDVGP